ncbi:MAG TPA: hypothetical protein VGS19_32325 [Streptosporangiaceae bacterium]|nr:hypothetical protein [Streptosporangiaceae bacterium]
MVRACCQAVARPQHVIEFLMEGEGLLAGGPGLVMLTKAGVQPAGRVQDHCLPAPVAVAPVPPLS